MSESPRERLSALMDGELVQAEAIRFFERLACDGELRGLWERYHLISDVLHNNLADVPGGGLLERVQRDLAAEPALYRLGLFRRESLRPLAGLALAASVAVIAVVGFRGYGSGSAHDEGVVARTERTQDLGLAQVTGEHRRFEPRLDAYLVTHSERAGGLLQGAIPHARLVAYDAGR